MSEYKNAATFLIEKILALGAEGGEMLRTLKVIMDDRDSLRAQVEELKEQAQKTAHLLADRKDWQEVAWKNGEKVDKLEKELNELRAANAELREAGEVAQEKFNSICCLAVEGPELEKSYKLFRAIANEASAGYNIWDKVKQALARSTNSTIPPSSR